MCKHLLSLATCGTTETSPVPCSFRPGTMQLSLLEQIPRPLLQEVCSLLPLQQVLSLRRLSKKIRASADSFLWSRMVTVYLNEQNLYVTPSI